MLTTANDKIMPTIAELFTSMNEFLGGMDNLNSKMEMSVQNLKDGMTEAFSKEWLQREKDNEALETRLEGQIENDRRKVQADLAFLRDEIKTIKVCSHCTVSDAASTGIGLGAGTHARPPPSRWAGSWVPRKLEFKGWNPDWSMKHIQGIQDDQVKVVLREIEEMMPSKVKHWTDWAQTNDNQAPWSRKTMVSLWFVRSIGKIMMIESLS